MADMRNDITREPVDPMRHDPIDPVTGAPAELVRPESVSSAPVEAERSHTGLAVAAIIAVLAIVGVVAFSTAPGTDPATTAAIPQASDPVPMGPAPTPEALAPNEAPTREDLPAALPEAAMPQGEEFIAE